MGGVAEMAGAPAAEIPSQRRHPLIGICNQYMLPALVQIRKKYGKNMGINFHSHTNFSDLLFKKEFPAMS